MADDEVAIDTMRYLGIDFGERRVGLAISDENARVATPLAILERSSDAQVIAEIFELVQREEVGHLVVGEPLDAEGRRGPAAERARRFARKLARSSPIGVSLADEALTSKEAARRLGRLRPRRGRIDDVAAQILLQQVLDEPAGRRLLDDGLVP